MSIEVTMPKLSDTMEEGKILHWVKSVGDAVRPGDVLAEVETDKANMELEAYDEGVLAEVRVGEGESAPVGAVIALLAPASEPRRATGTVRSEPAAPASTGDPVRASPRARRIADEHGVDLHAVRGSGPGGRIVERDVQGALADPGAGPRPAEKPSAPSAPAPERGGRRVELSRVRRTTARRMAEAKRDVPHFYASADISMDEAVRLKEGLAALAGDYADITYTHLVLKAVGVALARVPDLNASYEADSQRLHEAVNVGLVTAVEDGLVVPVVRGCDRAPLAALVRQVQGLLERARAGRFAPDDLSGGTFTVSNLGMFPVTHFAAVINPPQAAILAVGAIRETAVVRGGQLAPGRLMTVTLSCDHRVVDGVLAARFLAELKTLLEGALALLA